MNYTEQLEHRLRMVQDDLNILTDFIIQEGLEHTFNKVNRVTGDPALCNINNIAIACDLSNEESLKWGMYE